MATATNYRAKALDKLTGAAKPAATTVLKPPDQSAAKAGGSMGAPNMPKVTGTLTMAQPVPGAAQPTGQYTPSFDVSAQYDQMLKDLNDAANAGFANTEQQISGQKTGINQQYDALNKQAYVNARLSALGNNEALAAQGLAGNAYDAPQSGYSESSRVAQNAALGNAINSNQLARQNALDALTGQVNTARIANQGTIAGNSADIMGQKANAMQNQYQFDRNLALQEAGLTGTYGGQQTLAAKQAADQLALQIGDLTGTYNGQDTLAGAAAKTAQDQQKFDNAYNMMQLYGKVMTQDQADALGVPIGTTTMQFQSMNRSGSSSKGYYIDSNGRVWKSYDDYKKYMDSQNPPAQANGGGGGGGLSHIIM